MRYIFKNYLFGGGKHKNLMCISKKIIFLLVFLCSGTVVFASFRILVFNPESPISRSRYIKKKFKAQCKKVGVTCEMQVFAKSVDFDRIVKVQNPEFAVVASYYYRVKKRYFKWKPVYSGYLGHVSLNHKNNMSRSKAINCAKNSLK